jgi:predicted small lipoprotein YifL
MKTLLVAVTTCATLALAGCGASGPKPLTKADFIKKADAICQKTNDKLDAASAGLNDDSGMGGMAKFVTETAIPEVKAQVAAIRKLTPPKADADTIDAVLDEVESAIAKIAKDPMILMKDGIFDKADKMAKDYGFVTCAE